MAQNRIQDSRRVGIFGGTFDPFHLGHLGSMLQVADKFGLDEVRAIPTAASPLRAQTEGSSAEHRLKMLELGIEGHGHLIVVDPCEVKRGGVSYTIDTLDDLNKRLPGTTFLLIIGLDQFLTFDKWHRFDEILSQVDLIVTSRPGNDFPYSEEDLPAGLRKLVADYDSQQVLLNSGRTIYFNQLKDVEVSASEVRKKIRFGQSVQALVPSQVEAYIRSQKLYESVQKKIGDFQKFSEFCENILIEKGGVNTKIYDLRDRQSPSEFALIASGTSTRHATALSEHLIREVKKEFGVWPEGIEGQAEGRWIVVDYGALIVHSFYDYVRQEYKLENLWLRPTKG